MGAKCPGFVDDDDEDGDDIPDGMSYVQRMCV